MRTITLAVLATSMAALIPVSVEARSMGGNMFVEQNAITGQGHRVSRKATNTRYASKRSGKRHASKGKRRNKYSSRRGGSRRVASASRSCLTGSARALLGRIESRFGSVQIISTCRPGARIATTGKISKHASGQAIDFRVPGKKRQVVQWLIANHRSGGTMTYSDMDHIHVDVGYHFVALNRRSGRT